MPNSFVVRAAFGLGISSSQHFIDTISKYKTVKDLGLAYVNSTTMKYNGTVRLVVLDSLKELIRVHKHIRSHQVIVISEVPTLLKEITGIVPLDFSNARSFEFNFRPIDTQPVLSALRSKTARTEIQFTGYDNLGFHVSRASNSDDFIAAFVALNANLAFNYRNPIRIALDKFFSARKCNPKTVVATVRQLTENLNLETQTERFVELFEAQASGYYAAINSDQPSAIAAKRYNVDAYAVSYLKRVIRSVRLTNERATRNNVVLHA